MLWHNQAFYGGLYNNINKLYFYVDKLHRALLIAWWPLKNVHVD